MKGCTVYKTLSIIGKKWTLLILLELYKGKDEEKQFNHLKKHVEGITPKVLSERLSELEFEGLVNRRVDDDRIPVRCLYSLTESGKELIKVLQDIKGWGLKWKFENDECMTTQCKRCVL
ncbi:MAG TPA: helix-turn-helix domain-containing protein [Candidatus Methanofastidiosa archaeon]|nr:helix-turn-helix domain-containing protein [Candidatus Methanofastidiosa archaeon]HPR41149.1 helix-turn-helix domain-containing protein [Candidatus Methanofastidiosa archaeon]